MSTTTNPTGASAPTHTVELARYTTRREHDAPFLAAQPAAVRAIRAAFPALASLTTVRLASTDERTTWVDVAVWTSAAEAHRAAAACAGIPEFAACARYIETLVAMEHGEVSARY